MDHSYPHRTGGAIAIPYILRRALQLDRTILFRAKIPSITVKRRGFMSRIPDWRYLFLPEDSSPAAYRNPPSAPLRIGKTLLWALVAVLCGLLLGHPSRL
jgi:hypothetical protein